MKILLITLFLLGARSMARAATNTISPDDIPALRPARAEIPPGFWEQHGVWIVLGGILLLAFAGAAIWFLVRPKPAVVVPPGARARQALEALRHQAEDGALLSRTSQLLRRFFAATFGLPPAELTTTEFCRAIETDPQVGPALSAAVSEFLRQCDRRKFSPAPFAEPLGAVGQALQFVEQAEARQAQLRQAAQAAVGNASPSAPQPGGIA
jgi:hypothetical protein